MLSAAQGLQTTIDPLYGDTIYSTTPKEVARQWSAFTAGEILSVSFVRQKHQNLLKTFIITGKYLPLVKKDDSINIKFSDGQILTIKPVREFSSDPITTRDAGFTITCFYQLTADDISYLKLKKVNLIRFNYQGKFIDYTIDDTGYGTIQKAAQLLFP